MKKIILLSLLISMNSWAGIKKAYTIYNKSKDQNKFEQMAHEMAKSKYYFSSTIFIKEHLVDTNAQLSVNTEQLVEDLILKTGTLSFIRLNDNILNKFDSPSLGFILGLKKFKQKQYKQSLKALEKLADTHRFSPEAYFMKGSNHSLLSNIDEALEDYKKCKILAENFEDQSKNEKLKRYFAIIRESCQIHIARTHFKNRDYKKAIEIYKEIPKSSYRWPYILMELAWANYHLGDYNRALGILVTYNSPLLSSYFFPEAEVLSALSYFKLCLWEDGLVKIHEYYKVHRKNSDSLKNILLPHKNDHKYFLDLLLKPVTEIQKEGPFIRNLTTQIRKKVKFSLDLINLKKLQAELKIINKYKSTQFIGILKTALNNENSMRTKYLNHYIKRQMFDVVNDIHHFSYEMFNIRLEVMALKRDLLYSNKKLVSDRNRGSHKNVNRSVEEQFYTFNGAFWADELGDFSFGLKSNCKRVRKKKRKVRTLNE